MTYLVNYSLGVNPHNSAISWGAWEEKTTLRFKKCVGGWPSSEGNEAGSVKQVESPGDNDCKMIPTKWTHHHLLRPQLHLRGRVSIRVSMAYGCHAHSLEHGRCFTIAATRPEVSRAPNMSHLVIKVEQYELVPRQTRVIFEKAFHQYGSGDGD